MSGSRFERWCALNGSIALPASPSVVAAFISDNGGLDAQTLYAEIAALDAAHEELGYCPPGRSTIAIAAFNLVHHVEPPRSWTPDEKQFFMCLGWGVQMAIARREAERDRALSKAQNAAAEKRKEIEAELAEQRKAVEHELAEQRRITNRMKTDMDNGIHNDDKAACYCSASLSSEKTLLERITELRAECDQRIHDEALAIKNRDAPGVPIPVIINGLTLRHNGDSILAIEALEKAK